MLQEIDGVYYVSLPHPMDFSWYSLDGKKLKGIYLKKGRQKLILPDEKGPVILKMGKRSLKLIL